MGIDRMLNQRIKQYRMLWDGMEWSEDDLGIVWGWYGVTWDWIG